jgi:hypothetical protein
MGPGHPSGDVNRRAKPQPPQRPAPSGQTAAGRVCPRCQQPLRVVTGTYWCLRCGWGRQVLQAPAEAAAEAARPSAARRAAEEWAQAARLLPRWAWVMLGGLLAIGLGSLDAHLLLPPDSWGRAVWTTAQIIVGLVGLLLAQVAVCSLLGLQRDAPGLLDLLMPDRVWRVAIRRLPVTRWPVCFAAWGLGLVAFALLLVGGLTYWLPKKGETKRTVHVAKLLDIKKEQLEAEEAAGAEASAAPGRPEPTPTPEASEPAAKPETARCVVVGYTVENDEVTSLVVARIEGDELRYAGTVRPTLTAEQKEDLLKRFGRLASARPVFPDFETPVVWLKPELHCEVEHAGAADGALLKEPRFKGLIEPEKPDPDEGAPTDGPPARPDSGPKTPAPVPTTKPDRAAPGRP